MLGRLWLGFKLRPPVAERLERDALRLAILPLIQVATLPRLVVRPPESFALTRPRSVLVHHLALLICKPRARTDRVDEPQEKCARNGRLHYRRSIPCTDQRDSLLLEIISLLIQVG